ncbi:hypothetical protein TBLA_0B02710 [Henningerozyma blattae CBS 6284]|uniref:adenosylmethionine decarboxylase n=1 Tax=Henningerozyma blattae (strain ATCC 34711 / CBS 6284 / DSM 70876 / NBRC 10599 / NRRL Y-10934 / UCD 77-7) TaxID=1071380 RepID=I2GYB1_HENB6|nr:hypothetical protein TBLA_0B02710 [Tetrapisispora blattae CBS 6284]CCH59113.1 hypothetical protein TBLA_0B02710 [Tetrapisispora blattae CBS 6284]
MSASTIPQETTSFIDYEKSNNLDSTDAFEGPEKLLEIWFYPETKPVDSPAGENKTLRDIAYEDWVSILKLVNCEILSFKKTSQLDAYLLSESSFFVYDYKVVLKTCGTTTTLFCLQGLFNLLFRKLEHWKDDLYNPTNNKYTPYKVFYSRRCFIFPSKQKSIHQKWSDEVKYLDQFFANGRNYLVGRNPSEAGHWNLYITDTNKILENKMVNNNPQTQIDREDETMEMLMTGLDQTQMKYFHKDISSSTSTDDGHEMGNEMTRCSKIDKIYTLDNNSTIISDSFAFTPCGYSSNNIIDESNYFTLHVTPEKGWSYASFESNIPESRLTNNETNRNVMQRVLDIFRPQEFCLTLFQNTRDPTTQISKTSLAQSIREGVPGYVKMDHILYDLDDYQLLYVRLHRITNN